MVKKDEGRLNIPLVIGSLIILGTAGFYLFFAKGGRVLAPSVSPIPSSPAEIPPAETKSATESARLPELPPQLVVGVFCENLFLAAGKPPEPVAAETAKELLSLRARAMVSVAADTTEGLLELAGAEAVPDRGFMIEEELVSEATASVRTAWNYARQPVVKKNFGLILESGEWKIDVIQ